MVCPSCLLDNDPSSAFCARCNTALTSPAYPPAATQPQVTYQPASGFQPAGSYQPLSNYQPVSGPPRRRWSSGAWPFAALGIAVVVASTVLAVKLTGHSVPRPAVAASGTSQTTGASQPTDVTTAATTAATTQPDRRAAAHSQAVAIDALLDASTASRRKLNAAIDRVNRCTDVGGALADLRTVGQERQAQLNSAAGLDLSALASGEQIRSALRTALQYSLDADRNFVGWAETAQANGCRSSGQSTAYYNEGLRLSDLAGNSKEQFLGVWNPVAGDLGLPIRSRDNI